MRVRLLVVLALLLLTAPARADTAAQVVTALRSSPVYQAAGLSLVDAAALSTELAGTDPQVDVAVVASGSATTRAAEVLRALGDPELVLLVVTADQELAAAAGASAAQRGVDAARALSQELAAAPPQPFDQVQMTALVGAFAERVAGQVSGDGPDVTRTVPPAASPTTAVSSSPVTASSPRRASHTVRWVLVGLLVAVGLGLLLVGRRRRGP